MDKFWLQLPVWQQQNVTVTWIEFERLQCSQVTYKYIWKPFSKALVPKNRNKAGKAIIRCTQNLQHSVQFEQHRSCQFRTHWKLQTWVQLPNCSGQPAGCCCPQNTHTEHLRHTHPAKSQRCSQPVPHHGCGRWVRAALLHKQVDIFHILLNGQILASTTCMAATKRDRNVD